MALTFADTWKSVTIYVGGCSDGAGNGTAIDGIKDNLAHGLDYGKYSVAVCVFCAC